MSVGSAGRQLNGHEKEKIRINDAESPPPTGETEPLFCLFSMTATSNSQRHVYKAVRDLRFVLGEVFTAIETSNQVTVGITCDHKT